jgi:hypothetical protein
LRHWPDALKTLRLGGPKEWFGLKDGIVQLDHAAIEVMRVKASLLRRSAQLLLLVLDAAHAHPLAVACSVRVPHVTHQIENVG